RGRDRGRSVGGRTHGPAGPYASRRRGHATGPRFPALASAGAEHVVAQNAGEHAAPEPGVVEERAYAAVGIAVANQKLLVKEQQEREPETAEEPGPKLGPAADEREREQEQQRSE